MIAALGEIMPTMRLVCCPSRGSTGRFMAMLCRGLLASGLAGCATPASQPLGPPNALRLSDDRSEIIMTGEMKEGLAAQVKLLLDASPSISAIELESPGGSGNEGYKLALLVKEHHLATFSARLCASACTFVYMAGEPRFFAVNGKLGFHSTSVNGLKSEEGNKFSQLLYQEAGVPQTFIDRALATPPTGAWFPTTEELVKAHVVTDIVTDQHFLPSSHRYWSSETELDRGLKSNHIIETVARLDPPSYQKIHDIFADGARQGRGIAQIAATSRDYIQNELVPSYFRRAPDDLVIRYRRLQLDGLHYLEENAPGTCITVAAPKTSISEFSDDRLSPQLNTQVRQALTELIIAALQHPDHPEEDAVNKRTAAEFDKAVLTKSPGFAKALDAVKRDPHNQKLYCQVIEAYNAAILEQPPATAARIFRAQQLKGD